MATSPKNVSPADRDIARVRGEVASRLGALGVAVFDSDSALDVIEILEAVQEFERAVESHGGDLMVDEPPNRGEAAPDDPRFLVPRRAARESRSRYVARLAAATAAVRERDS